MRQLAGPAGRVVASYSFDPFGVPLDESGGEPYGFTGEQWDASAGLVFLRARYYQPEVGRFISRDQWGGREQKPQTLNSFAYVTNDPINQVDPSGYLSDRLIQESLNGLSLDQTFGFQDRWGLLALLRDAKIGDTVTARYLDFPYILYEVDARWPLRADPKARSGWCIRCGYDNKLRFHNVQDGEELTLPDFVMQLARNAARVHSLARNWRSRSIELRWYELNEHRFYSDFRFTSDVPDAIAWGLSVDVPGLGVSGEAGVTYIVDLYGNWYMSVSGSIAVGAGLPLSGEYWEGYASGSNLWTYRLSESALKNIIEGPALTPAAGIGVGAGLEEWTTGAIGWFGVSTSAGSSISFDWTFHMGKKQELGWDWVLWTIPGYDSAVKDSPNPHGDDPSHNCGCQ